jgi:glyoxylase I family protein
MKSTRTGSASPLRPTSFDSLKNRDMPFAAPSMISSSSERPDSWRPMPDGRRQEPGGWNRIVLYVENLESIMSALKGGRARFRNDVEAGPGGKQIQIEDPDGNPIELYEAPRTAAK